MLVQRQNPIVLGGQAQVSVLKPGSDTMCNTLIFFFFFSSLFSFLDFLYNIIIDNILFTT
jgi:hypothetical protein